MAGANKASNGFGDRPAGRTPSLPIRRPENTDSARRSGASATQISGEISSIRRADPPNAPVVISKIDSAAAAQQFEQKKQALLAQPFFKRLEEASSRLEVLPLD
jgi:hypothetical protein